MRGVFVGLAMAGLAVLPAGGAAAQPASGRAAEIADIKAQMSLLEARLAKLENETPPEAPPVATIPAQQASNSAMTAAAPARASDLPPPSPTGHAPTASGQSLQILAGSSGGEATLTLSDNPVTVPTVEGDHYRYQGWVRQLQLSAPLSKDGGQTAIATLDKLANGANLSVTLSNYSRAVRTGELDQAQINILKRAQQACESDPDSKFKTPARDGCGRPDQRQHVVETYSSAADAAKYNEAAVPAAGFATAWGLTAGVGYASFSFTDPSTLKSRDTGRAQYKAGLFVSLLPNGYPASATLSGTYEYAFSDQDPEVVCPLPGPNDKTITCASGPFGKPKHQDSELIALDVRTWLPSLDLPLVKRVAIAPQFTYDARSSAKAIDLPIYLAADSDGNLIGGLRLGYSTEKSQKVVSVFVDAPFTIFH